jgi:hypothetical protein
MIQSKTRYQRLGDADNREVIKELLRSAIVTYVKFSAGMNSHDTNGKVGSIRKWIHNLFST